ncbi:MAG: helix-turn-helix domain-containing protein [Acidimicrobiales bacterium]
MTVVVRPVAPPLDGLVRAITYQGGEQPRTAVEKILPDPSISIWVNLNRDEFRWFGGPADDQLHSVPGAMLAGARSRASVIEFEAGRAYISVSFALGAASKFFAAPLAQARDALVPLEALWGRSGANLRERLLEAPTPHEALGRMEEVLLEHMADSLVSDRAAATAAARRLSRGASVREVASALGLVPRTLRRHFVAEVGLTPKRFARVRRLQRVVRALDGQIEVDWAAVAVGHGYSDQSHLVHDFRDLAGVTPSEYLRSRINGPNHLRLPLLRSGASRPG